MKSFKIEQEKVFNIKNDEITLKKCANIFLIQKYNITIS